VSIKWPKPYNLNRNQAGEISIELNREEVRVIGCLLEKAVTTPDQYPLSLNALTSACNQKSSREPVMNLQVGDVQRTVRNLKEKYLLGIEEGFKNNTEKYSQRFCNSLLGEYQFNPAEYAIVSVLLLRGPQTPGELRTRCARLHVFDDNQAVAESLNSLMERDAGPVVARLPKQRGRMDHEYAHLFSGEIESIAEELVVQRAPPVNKDLQIQKLEARIEALENALVKLAEQLGEEVILVEKEY